MFLVLDTLDISYENVDSHIWSLFGQQRGLYVKLRLQDQFDKMLSLKKKSKPRKRSLGFGSRSSINDRVVMLCESIPSEASSYDSGRGSNSSGTRSSGDEMGQGWKAHSFHGTTRAPGMSSSTRPLKQYSVRDVRLVASRPVHVQYVERASAV